MSSPDSDPIIWFFAFWAIAGFVSWGLHCFEHGAILWKKLPSYVILGPLPLMERNE